MLTGRGVQAAAIITDPPYGTTALGWDEPLDLIRWWKLVAAISGPLTMAVVFSQQPFTTDLIASNRKQWRYELIWEKSCPVGFLDAKLKPLRAHEHVQVFSARLKGSIYNPQKTAGKPYKAHSSANPSPIWGRHLNYSDANPTGERYPRSVLRFASEAKRNLIHPTQKPLALLEWLVRTYTHPGDLVLDPFSGSGTTALACLRTGRRCIAVERDPVMFARSAARLEAAASESQRSANAA